MNAPLESAPPARRVAAWVLAVQCLLALSWTLYVVFLPGLLAAAGIDKRWFVYVLIADQAIFAVSDWAAGVWADRVASELKRTGRLILAVTMISSAALLAMPWIAQVGNPALLLAIIFVWVATSSALRAPVFALLGRIHEPNAEARIGMVSMALVGISLASAVGPFFALLLKNLDSRLPLALSALSLVAAGLWTTRAEALLPKPVKGAGRGPDVARRAWTLAAIVLVAAFGTQVLTFLVATPLFARFVGADASVWGAWFWVGFTIGLFPGARAADGARPLLHAAVALVVALAASALAMRADTVLLLTASIVGAGACWGVFVTVAFNTAVSLSSGPATARGVGPASGLLFSALALAAVGRLAQGASGQAKAPYVPDLTPWSWFTAVALLALAALTVYRGFPPRDRSPRA